MTIQRPDLTHVDAEVRAYIEALEAELEHLREPKNRVERDPTFETDEPPTTLNILTVSAGGLAKRTPRHLYSRQRRGGMGVFDLETTEDDPPTSLVIADESQDLLVLTNQARAFRLPLGDLPESPVRSRGQILTRSLPLGPAERVAVVLPHRREGYLIVVTQSGQVRRLRYHLFGDNMNPGVSLYDLKELGPPAAACWTTGSGDLFIASRQGRAIRFEEQQVPLKGCLGLRLNPDDAIAAVTGVQENSGVFLLSADGKGIIRLMSGFSPNKAPGSGGKVAMKTDQLIGAIAVAEDEDIFIISSLSKIIRFQAAEVSTTAGVVQGVNCIALRADEAVALARSPKI